MIVGVNVSVSGTGSPLHLGYSGLKGRKKVVVLLSP